MLTPGGASRPHSSPKQRMKDAGERVVPSPLECGGSTKFTRRILAGFTLPSRSFETALLVLISQSERGGAGFLEGGGVNGADEFVGAGFGNGCFEPGL